MREIPLESKGPQGLSEPKHVFQRLIACRTFKPQLQSEGVTEHEMLKPKRRN